MATLNSVLTKLQSLLQSLNGKTGRTDSTFNSAINALPSKKTISDVTVSGKTVTAPAGIYFSQVQMEVGGITLNVYQVNIKSNIGNCTAYYTAADGKQYTKTITSTSQAIYVAEKTTLRVVSPSGTLCELSGTTYSQINEGDTACLYMPAVANPNLMPTLTITVVAGAKYGGLPVYDYSKIDASHGGGSGNYFTFDASVTTPTVFEDDITIRVPKSEFGDVNKYLVPKTRTFTSKDGVCIQGELQIYDGSYKPIANYEQNDSNSTYFDFYADSNPFLVEDCIDVLVPRTNFGNAKASDVKAGVTFTSADGVNVTGTYEGSGSGSSIDLPWPTMTPSYNEADPGDGIEEDYISIRASYTIGSGYVTAGTRYKDMSVTLSIEGNEAVARCGDVAIRRTLPSSSGSEILVVSICDLDVCGPYYITYIDRYGDQMTETLEAGDCRTLLCLPGTTLTVEPAGQWSSYSTLYLIYGDETESYYGPDVPLPSNVVECYIDIYG